MTTVLLSLILLVLLGPAFMEGIGLIFLFVVAWAVIGLALTWGWTYVYGPLDVLWPLLVTAAGSLLITAWLFSLPYKGRP